MDQIIEIRAYTLKAETSAQFQHLMLEQSVPMLRMWGTDVVAASPSLHSPDAYLLIRAYQNLAHRSQSQDEFYSSADWIEGPRDAIMACIDSYTTIVIAANHATIESLRAFPPPL